MLKKYQIELNGFKCKIKQKVGIYNYSLKWLKVV